MRCLPVALCCLLLCLLSGCVEENADGWKEVGAYVPFEHPKGAEAPADGGVYVKGQGFQSPYRLNGEHKLKAELSQPMKETYSVVHTTTGRGPKDLPMVWGISRGELPPDVKLYINDDGTKAVIEGTPSEAGEFQVDISFRTTPKGENDFPGSGGTRIWVTVE